MFLEERRMERQKTGPEEIRDWQQILSRWRRHYDDDNDYFREYHIGQTRNGLFGSEMTLEF